MEKRKSQNLMIADIKKSFSRTKEKKTVKLSMCNNCPHASDEIVKGFGSFKKQEDRKRKGRGKVARMVRS